MLGRIIFLIIFGFIYSMEQKASMHKSILIVLIFAVGGIVILELLKKIMKGLMLEEVKKDLEKSFDRAFMMLLPFVIFALVSKFYLKWEMVLAFFSTGIMTAGGILIYELQGKTKMKRILPIVITIYLFGFVTMLMNINKILEKAGGSL